MQNALANHGYLPRDGRNVRYSEVSEGLNQYGLSDLLRWIFAYPIFLEHEPKDGKTQKSWWSILTHPIDYALRGFGMRNPDQKDSENLPCLNLDQLGLHNVVEHDVSLSRLDIAQGDNITPQPDLIAGILASSSDGKTITLDDFVQLRRRRYTKQKADNPGLDFKDPQIQVACSETGLILKIFGDGKQVPVEYMKAFFQDGRLPREEGWRLTNTWWTLGFFELQSFATRMKGLLGPPGEAANPVVVRPH